MFAGHNNPSIGKLKDASVYPIPVGVDFLAYDANTSKFIIAHVIKQTLRIRVNDHVIPIQQPNITWWAELSVK